MDTTITPVARTRSRSSMVHPNVGWTRTDLNCTSGVENLSLAGPYYGLTEEMYDAVVPNFSRLQRGGFTIVNSLIRKQSIASASGQGPKVTTKANSCSNPVKHKVADYPNPSSLQLQFGSASMMYPPATLLTSGDISEALSIASTQAWSDCRNNSADVLEDIAEFKQTLGMLRNPLGKSADKLNRIWNSRLGKSSAGRAARNSYARLKWLRDMWLQYRFGVRPLIGTIEGVAEALKRDGAKHRRTARGKSTVTKTTTESGVLQYPGSDLGGARSYWTRTHTDEVVVRAGVLLEESVSFAGSVGIDASGMLALPWQLLPYSLVADWFANVGTFLEALIPWITKRPLQTWHSIERTRTVVIQYYGTYVPSDLYYVVNRPASEVYTFTEKTYSRASGIPGPVISFKPQAVEGVVNSLRIVDGLALISTLISRLGR